MPLLLVLAVLLPWSVWRQMRVHRVTREGLIKLPLIFAAIGALSLVGTEVPDGLGTVVYLAASLTISASIGAVRGALIPTWRALTGDWLSQGNRVTIGLWTLLIVTKIVLGTIAGVTGSLPSESVGEVFLFLGCSFAVQNLVVARRTLWRAEKMVTVTT